MAELNYTRGEWAKTKLEKDLRDILLELVKNIAEVRERKDQPEFNKGLDIFCEYEEAIQKILDKTASPSLYKACKDALNMLDAINDIYPTPKTQAVLKEALAKVEGK